MSKHDYHSFTDGGALIRPQRLSKGAYIVDMEVGQRAVRFVRKHAEDADLLIEILGLSGYDSDQTQG